jgi:hypothetical protein
VLEPNADAAVEVMKDAIVIFSAQNAPIATK